MLESVVSEVTVLEDRAVVLRRASIEVSSGDQQLRFGPMATALVKKTAVARVVGSSSCKILDVQASVVRVDHEDDELSEQITDMRRTLQEQTRRRACLAKECKSAAELLAKLRHETCADAAWGRFDRQEAEQRFAQLLEWQESLRVRGLEADREIDASEAVLSDLLKRQSQHAKGKVQSYLQISLQAQSAEQVELELEYVTPGAAWRPYHSASLREQKVQFASQGCVWQNTGEDWVDVKLRLSTRRLSLGTEPPPLTPDPLTVFPRSLTRAVEVRDLQDERLSPGAAAPPTLPGVQDGGEVQVLEAREQVTVISDGHAMRVPLFEFECGVELERVLYAEMAPAVILKSCLSNRASKPLLAGPVDLIREGALIGRTQLSFVAPGESFEMGWGADARVSVHRQASKGEDKEKMMSGWVRSRRAVTVKLGSLAEEPIDLTLRERIPVSEVKEVEVELEHDSVTEQAHADEDGFITWRVALGPRERKTYELAYVLKRRRDVVGV